MIKSKYNRYIFLLIAVVLLVGTFPAFDKGPAVGIAFFLVVASIQLLLRCPNCGNLACKMIESKGYALPIPRKCFNCDYRYK